ncbi:MAG: peptidylprolyl isomerase, partial [Patescibacteria group bacterium]
PNTGGSQFFIVQANEGTHYLNGRHAVFGQVFEGMDIVDAIAGVEADSGDKPLAPVTMKKVTAEVLK